MKRTAAGALRRPVAAAPQPPNTPASPAAPPPAAGQAPRVIRTLPELDEMLARLDEAALVSDDELRRGFQTFVMT